MKIYQTSALATLIALLIGCASNPSARHNIAEVNLELAKEYQPYRYTLMDNKQANLASAEWAGTQKGTLTDGADQLRSDIFKNILGRCGFTPEQRIDTRLALLQPPIVNEIWLFHDELSERDDKVTGLSVVMKQLPNGGGVDFSVLGDCHSKPLPRFYFSR